ncbi:uncharacterized protein TNCV_2500721 [Trichonephila clavipes]|nr:uncharacterized protein TNCV_2500721 [Trichonephila clavipes]
MGTTPIWDIDSLVEIMCIMPEVNVAKSEVALTCVFKNGILCCNRRGRPHNMLTKNQMIKFIDFFEVWFLPESVARVAAIIGDHRLHTPQHWSKETLDVFLGYSRPKQLPHVAKVDLVWQLGV